MINALFDRFNQLRKERYFRSSLFKTKKRYAFIGVGMHSLTNLYPLILHFGIDLKFILTKRSSPSERLAASFPGCSFIHSIDSVLNDPEVEGVFVCTKPDVQAGLLRQLLEKGKNVFVEKPPCSNLAELKSLIAIDARAVCKVGLQRRYWPGNRTLAERIRSARSYIYQFYFGPYLQGDVFNELFIHAIDYCCYLFGEFDIASAAHRKDGKGITSQLHVEHNNGISGLLELSTHFSWNDPMDQITINCVKEQIGVQYPLSVRGQQRPRRLLNIPAERLFSQPVITKEYFSAGRLIVPALELNTLFLQGFYHELESFVNAVESGDSTGSNDLIGLIPVYRILDQLRALSI
jgi:virulence factor